MDMPCEPELLIILLLGVSCRPIVTIVSENNVISICITFFSVRVVMFWLFPPTITPQLENMLLNIMQYVCALNSGWEEII